MITCVRRPSPGGAGAVAASMLLAAALAAGVLLPGCAAPPSPTPPTAPRPPTAPAPAPEGPEGPAPAAGHRVPTLPPDPGGLMPVFSHGPRDGGADGGKRVALTFDADMTRDQTDRAAAGEPFDNPGLVALLRAEQVPATVFMTGMWARTYPAQARDIGRDPLFEVANHSYSHYAYTPGCHGLPQLPPGEFHGDLERAAAAIRAAGVPEVLPYFRFPGGCYDEAALRALAPAGHTAVQWDVSSGDAFATDPGPVARTVLDGVRPGSVVVLHITRSAAPVTADALREVIPGLRARGYEFVRVSELIGDSAG